MQREASGLLVAIVLTLFVTTIAVWSYVIGAHTQSKRIVPQQQTEWRV